MTPPVLLAALLAVVPARGRATTFGTSASDRGNPSDELACRPGRRLDPAARAAASHVLPCGARVVVCRVSGGPCSSFTVLDRGPRRTRGGARPGDLDLAGPGAFDGAAVWWRVR